MDLVSENVSPVRDSGSCLEVQVYSQLADIYSKTAVNQVATTSFSMPSEPETATPQLFGALAPDYLSISPDYLPVSRKIEEMKAEFDAMEKKIHIVNPRWFSAIAKKIAAFVKGLFSSNKIDKSVEVRETLQAMRQCLDNKTEFVERAKNMSPDLSDLEAVEMVDRQFKAYVLQNLNYTLG